MVAIARNGVIGRAGALPWAAIPEDMQHFKQVTKCHAVVMGRKTWDSLPPRVRPLPGRQNIVVTRNEAAVCHCAHSALSVEDALRIAWSIDPEPCVIGGAEIYRQTMHIATRVLLTEIDAIPAGDSILELDRSAFHETSRERGVDPRITFVTLER